MPRSKGGNVGNLKAPAIRQDNRGLEQDISTTIIGEFVTPLEVRIETIEAGLAAIQRNSVQIDQVQLRAGARGGTLMLEPEAGFAEDTIGRPVLINQGPSGDQDEGQIVAFTGEILDQRRMRVRWNCAGPAPRMVQVVYLIG